MNIYVGNLAYSVTETDLRALFERHGTVESAEVVFDRRSNRSRGYGFVRMPDDAGRAAIAALNGSELQGRQLRVDESRPRPAGATTERRPSRGRGPGGGPTRHAGERRPAAERRPTAAPEPAVATAAGVMGFLRRLFGRH